MEIKGRYLNLEYEWEDLFKKLSSRKAKKLLLAMFEYRFNGVEFPEFKGKAKKAAEIIFPVIELSRKKSLAGSKGGKSKKQAEESKNEKKVSKIDQKVSKTEVKASTTEAKTVENEAKVSKVEAKGKQNDFAFFLKEKEKEKEIENEKEKQQEKDKEKKGVKKEIEKEIIKEKEKDIEKAREKENVFGIPIGILSGKPDDAKEKTNGETKTENAFKSEIAVIIDYLNSKCGTHYKNTTNSTITKINARLREGFTVNDFQKVIDTKYDEWHNDENFSKFLRPETLFSSKFESYLNQIKPKTKGSFDVHDFFNLALKNSYKKMSNVNKAE